MAQDFVPKRLALAHRYADAATKLVETIEHLQTLGPVLAQSGTAFADTDFAGSDIQHLNAWTLHNLRDAAPRLLAVLSERIDPNDNNSPLIGVILRAVKRG
jgi:hypothetical protein